METKNYQITEESRRFLDALNAFQQFKNTFLTALTSLYSEEQGEQLYLSHADLFTDVERVVMDCLREQFIMNMGTDKTVIEI